jgi:hypothetical protein
MDAKDRAQEDLIEKQEEVPLGLWRHYKGGEYIVFALSVQEDTCKHLVHYYSLDKKTRWTRSLSNFVEIVTPPGSYLVPRFRFVRVTSMDEHLEAVGLAEGVRKVVGELEERNDAMAIEITAVRQSMHSTRMVNDSLVSSLKRRDEQIMVVSGLNNTVCNISEGLKLALQQIRDWTKPGNNTVLRADAIAAIHNLALSALEKT